MNRRIVRIIGWVLVIGSFPVWYSLFLAPFLPIPVPQRFAAAGGLAVFGEAMFWVGGLILGADFVSRRRRPKVTTGKSFAGVTMKTRPANHLPTTAACESCHAAANFTSFAGTQMNHAGIARINQLASRIHHLS